MEEVTTMRAAQVATIANPLIDRLNAVRIKHDAGRGEALGQIKFQSNGLRIADRASYLAIKGMMAVIENDADSLLEAGDELQRNFPQEFRCHLNILRSYVSLRFRDESRQLVQKLAEDVDTLEEAAVLAVCSLGNGDLQETRDLACSFLDRFQAASESSTSLGLVRNALEICQSALDAGIPSGDLCNFLDTAASSLSNSGWSTPHITFELPCADLGASGPLAFVRFLVDPEGDVDAVMSAEDLMLDALAASNDPIFRQGAICVSVGSFGSSGE